MAKNITSRAARPAATARTIGTEPAAAPKGKARREDTVQVKAVKSFHDSHAGEFKNSESKPYPVPRGHAAQLHANGLVKYVNKSDEKKEPDTSGA